MGVGGDFLLDADDLGDGGVGVDVAAAVLAAVHGTHDEDGGAGGGGAGFVDGEAELLVEGLDEAAELAFVGAVVDDDEVGAGLLEFGGPALRVEGAGDHRGGSAVEAERVVEDAGVAAAEVGAEELDGAGGDGELDRFCAGRQRDGGGAGPGGRGAGVEIEDGVVVGGDGEGAGAGLSEEADDDGGLRGGAGVAEGVGSLCAGAAGEDGAAEAVDALLHAADAGGVLLRGGPAFVGDVDVAVAVPGPGLGTEVVAVAGVAEALLEDGADVARDEVGGGGGVAVVEDGGDDGLVVILGEEEFGEEGVEGAAVVDEVGGDGGGCVGWARGLIGAGGLVGLAVVVGGVVVGQAGGAIALGVGDLDAVVGGGWADGLGRWGRWSVAA